MYNTDKYLRQIGISKEQFEKLLSMLGNQIEKDLQENPMKRRGVRSQRNIRTRTKLTLTLYYLRNYPTFMNLGSMLNITESYANKIFHKIVNYMMEFVHPQNSNNLLFDDVKKVIVDVAEQPIEKPMSKQKLYYSGKKKRHTIKAQLIISSEDKNIRSIQCDKGKIHDFKLFQRSKVAI